MSPKSFYYIPFLITLYLNPQGPPGPDGRSGEGGIEGNPVRFLMSSLCYHTLYICLWASAVYGVYFKLLLHCISGNLRYFMLRKLLLLNSSKFWMQDFSILHCYNHYLLFSSDYPSKRCIICANVTTWLVLTACTEQFSLNTQECYTTCQ